MVPRIRRHARTLALTVILAVAGSLLCGCNTSGCTDNHSAIPLASFHSAQDGFQVTLDSLEIYGIGAPGDSLVLSPNERAKEVYLPMRSTARSTSWRIVYRQALLDSLGVADTLTFSYDAQPFLAGDECGAMYNYRLRGVEYTHNIIDSVGVVDSLITNADVAQLRIYFRISATN